MKGLIVLLLVLVAILQYKLWFDSSGIFATIELHKKLEHEITENTKLMERNELVAHDITDLKEGKDSVEERARNDLGMIKDGETYYQYVD